MHLSEIIPKRLLQKIDESDDWSADVKRVVSNVSVYFNRGEPFFFPEYTIHGIKHIVNVLDICNNLIPDDCIEHLTSRDISLLIISVIMHDIGMFIERDGIFQLLYGHYSDKKIDDLDKETWNQEWNSYISKVRRYPDKVLLKLFGTATQIQVPPSDMTKLSYIDIIVYGDFLRQNHPRLSHQIIETGFMGIETVDVLRETVINAEVRNLIGLLARSHGMDIRNTNTYLSNRFVTASEPKGIPIFYLMALLRIADYLDAGQGRAPRQIQQMHKHISPLSQSEWDWNQSIDYQDYRWVKMKEILEIHSNPKNTIQFTNVEKWLKNVQHEIDYCWAVLGEHYGVEKKWLLSIRRISSNITDPNTREIFEKLFLTKPAILSVNPDILKLLIGPLYNENPSCGLRELIQNAVDACLERAVKEKASGNKDYRGEVIVKICVKEKYLLIEDNGIGMTADTLVNYFLVAGSSYRYSDNWANNFIVNEKSIIPRTGKFGIGVLSAFLLGKHIHVKTRNINDVYGLTFDLELNDSVINITKDSTVNVGTQIKIKLTDGMLKKISCMKLIVNNDGIITSFGKNITDSFDDLRDEVVQGGHIDKYIRYEWYFFENPCIKYVVDEIEKTNTIFVPDGNSMYPNWFSLENTNFKSYKWHYGNPLESLGESNYHNIYNPLNGVDYGSFDDEKDRYKRERDILLFYNGIIVPYVSIPNYKKRLYIEMPCISIVDYNNIFEISLDRNSCQLPNIKELYIELYKYYIASMLVCPLEVIDSGKFKSYNLIFYNNCFTIDNESFLKVANIARHYGIINANIRQTRIKLTDYPFLNIELDIKQSAKDSKKNTGYSASGSGLNWHDKNILNISCDSEMKNYLNSKYKILFETELNSKRIYKTHSSKSIENIHSRIDSKMVIEYSVKNSKSAYHNATFEEMENYFAGFYKDGKYKDHTFEEDSEYDDLIQVINEYLLGDIWIPVDMKERREKYKYAFDCLNNYIIDCESKNNY